MKLIIKHLVQFIREYIKFERGIKMKIEELKEKVLSKIENNLWRLGEDGEDSVFPNFDLNSHELEYGVQRERIIFLL